jgi:hypothetical protein
VVASDGISTKTVKAVPCGTVARETDGSTTCIGFRMHRSEGAKSLRMSDDILC